MNETPPSKLIQFIRIPNPWMILASLMFYVLGGGIVDYLGTPIRVDIFIVGWVTVLLLVLSAYYLNAFYDLVESEIVSPRRRSGNNSLDPQLSKAGLALISVTLLTSGAMLTVYLVTRAGLDFAGYIIFGSGFLLAIAFAAPPFRFEKKGLGNLLMSLLVVNVSTMLAVYLQMKDLHPLVIFITFPLLFLFLAMLLTYSLESYAQDIAGGRKTLMVVLGWQRGMAIHNVMVPIAYLVSALAVLLRLVPWSITWPALLTLPFAIYQVWHMNQIAGGAKPKWRLLTLIALATSLVSTYLFTLSLWVK